MFKHFLERILQCSAGPTGHRFLHDINNTLFFFFKVVTFWGGCLFIYFYLFIYCCVGSSFLREDSLQLRQVGATLHRGARASHYRGLSCCGAQAPDAQAQ